MASKIEICNRALSKLGADRIVSLDDDVKASRAMKSAWNIVLDSELRDHTWNFSVKRTSLPALSESQTWGYSYKYALPSDFLKLLEIRDLYPNANVQDYRTTVSPLWQVEGGVIMTDVEAPLYIRYVGRVEDTSLFDASFIEAMACRLAAETAVELTDNGSRREFAWKEYERAVRMALRSDAIEQPNDWPMDDSWVTGRI